MSVEKTDYEIPYLILTIMLIPLLWSCDEIEKIEPVKECLYTAVIEDFTGLDGCGYLFKLSNGEYINPVRPFLRCGTPPIPDSIKENPLWGFEFEHGKKVRIGFEYVNGYVNNCMKGRMAIITCIETINTIPDEVPAK